MVIPAEVLGDRRSSIHRDQLLGHVPVVIVAVVLGITAGPSVAVPIPEVSHDMRHRLRVGLSGLGIGVISLVGFGEDIPDRTIAQGTGVVTAGGGIDNRCRGQTVEIIIDIASLIHKKA